MKAIKIRLHYRRDQESPNKKGAFISPLTVEIEYASDIANSKSSSPVSVYCLKDIDAFKFYAFKGTIAGTSRSIGDYIAANMHVPNFFNECDPKLTGVNGLFLISLGTGLGNVVNNYCKGDGKHGCPARISLGDISSFSFNGMNFYPFMMRDFSIGYYVCDKDSKDYDWQLKHKSEFKNMFKVGVNSPLIFDATLGIYVTRDAELKK